jgi:hypothetical protein
MLDADRFASGSRVAADPRDVDAPQQDARPLAPAELAWAALLPCALAAVAAILLLGPPLGHALSSPGADALWPATWWAAQGRPEPVEYGRYVLALLAPLALAAAVLAGARRPPRLRPRTIRAVVAAGQAGLLALVAVAVLGQRNAIPAGRQQEELLDTTMLVVAAVLVLAALLAMRSAGAGAAVARIARERPWLRIACAAVAVAVAATWLLEAIQTDRLVEDLGQMNWTLTDPFAVLNGHDPLVDYRLVYAKLLPYPAALALLAFGTNAFVYTLFMTALSLLALVAAYAVLRRVAGSSLLALGLFVPLVAMSDMRHMMLVPAMWPMRYGGAFLLAWLVARQIDGDRPRRLWTLFAVAGVVSVNQLDFGIAALLACVAALLCARPPRSPRDVLRLAGGVGGGVLVAVAAVSLLTLARAGSLPRLELLLEWPRIFTNLGWFSMPMPNVGLHLAIYATFAAAIAVAAVRVARGAEDRLLTGMVAWSSVFGLLAGGYYAGRSDDMKLAAMFAAWSLALALLTVVCVRSLAARGWRSPTVAELLVLYGFALSICTIGQLSSPPALIRRLTAAAPPVQYRPLAKQFIAPHVTRGDKVAILLPEGPRLAYELGLDNVAPYQSQNAIVTRRQMQTLLDVLEREQIEEVFMPVPGASLLREVSSAPEHVRRLQAVGFTVGAASNGMLELHRSRD